jgi:hypothetical protein
VARAVQRTRPMMATEEIKLTVAGREQGRPTEKSGKVVEPKKDPEPRRDAELEPHWAEIIEGATD